MTFRVPGVPFLPILVIVLNTYLMMASESTEWVLFIVLIITCTPKVDNLFKDKNR
ncbi:hypothetical protein BpHYR1_001636 [Brachionus plicatilis]|uniref:Cationic amino acid transporter C-terminal domain-containing protein n=1 Tax=Brachionus plicatilis TaxID=10195 RepID=A0A3M7P6S1_BRAPC|nr:hypothetical protein BpHYR1_001636 [Brachionus plicatilis]